MRRSSERILSSSRADCRLLYEMLALLQTPVRRTLLQVKRSNRSARLTVADDEPHKNSSVLRAEALAEIVQAPSGLARSERGLTVFE